MCSGAANFELQRAVFEGSDNFVDDFQVIAVIEGKLIELDVFRI